MIKYECFPDYEYWYNPDNGSFGCLEYRKNGSSQAAFYLNRKFEEKEIQGLLSALNEALRVGYDCAIKDIKNVVRGR